MSDTTFEAVLRRDRWVVGGGLAVVAVLAWGYTLWMAVPTDISQMASMAMPQRAGWGAVEFFTAFVMWAVMMTAMMLPSVAPLVLLYAAAQRRRAIAEGYLAVVLFSSGYLAIWTAFSVVAALAQGLLHAAALTADEMGPVVRPLSGAILLLAGAYQFTPLKRVCLARCQSPLGFITVYWRSGRWGAFTMGVRHGTYCLGCCWPLMLLLFVSGVMNILWIAALAIFVLGEKLLPRGEWIGRVGGAVFLGWGLKVLLTG